MMQLAHALAWLLAFAWIWKAVTAAFGLRRIPDLRDPEFDRQPAGNPAVTVIVPARNEEQALPGALASLLAQDYENLRIIAVDDRSTDATGAIMDELVRHHPDRLRVLHIRKLPTGWLGKPHAMAMAARHAIAVDHPEYMLFTDADVFFEPQAVRRSLAQAVAIGADHFVTFPTPQIKSIGEGMLLGYLGVMGLWATRPWKASDPKAKRDSIGIGAFNMLRTAAYQQLGGFESLRMEILEDLTLARRVKDAGLRQRVAIAPGMVSLHWASGAMGVVNVMTKNLFAVFRFRIALVLVACLGLVIQCLAPFVFLFIPGTRVAAVLTLLAIAVLYRLSSRHSRIPALYAALFPVGAALFLYSLLRSAFTTLKAGGVMWRGTFYPLKELRKNKTPLR
ncbi:glycosyltransferase [Edaphobacter sp. 12200R-103]|uniref:glycosyltransferase n=1 Tax=Edaphobacter sp. 12200R-103 TaxID=2703788 RepID=UPI00138C5B73|nr:glycosyltransferase [Edaphobacter sp. 12200R-103]QHS51535.1 glycosyltransferase [Edaphobacter sp. 12200R-103]